MYECKCCNELNSNKFLVSHDYNYKIDNKEYIYNKCISCENIYLTNVPENLTKYYEHNYLPYKIIQNKEDKKILDKKIEKILKLNKKNILEIGPGNGELSKKLKDLNFDVTVFDFNDGMFSDLNKKQIRTFKVDFDKIDTVNSIFKYDLIICYHVIEHLKNPRNFFKNINNLLNDNGYVILTTPNSKSLSFKIFKKYWYHLDAPRHLNILNIKIIKRIKLNLKIVDVINKDHESFHVSKIGWETSAFYCFKDKKMIIFSYLIKLLKIPLTLLELCLGKSSQLTVILKK